MTACFVSWTKDGLRSLQRIRIGTIFEAYHGSSDLVVPWYIDWMGLFFCESCERLYMYNRQVHKFELPACPHCGDIERKRWIGLSAENVYRLATAKPDKGYFRRSRVY